MWNKKKELVESFKMLYAELENSKLIMSNDIITKFLKFITTNEPVFFIYKHASQNFDFDTVFKESVSNGRIKLPDDDYKIIVLVTKLLFDIDRGKIEYLSFLNNMFPRVNIADSFYDFCVGIVYPYVCAFERLLNQSDRVVVDNVNQEPTSKLPRQLTELLQNNIILIYEQLASDKSLQDSRRQEISMILEGLDFAVDGGNTMLIQSLWYGLKYALVANKAFSSQVKAFENELKNYSLIDG